MSISLTLENQNELLEAEVKPVEAYVKPSSSTVKNMQIAFWLNLLFSCIEFVGGILTNSVTILSDAIHDLGDSIVIGISLVLEKKSIKGRTKKFTYGQQRFSVLAALFTSLILIMGSVFIVYEAINRLINLQEVKSEGVIWLAVLGIVFNGFAVLRLKKSSKDSLNQRSIMLHLLEDVFGWVAVLIGAIVMYYTSWFWIDPLLSLTIASIILYNAVKNIGSALQIFLQAVPNGFDETQIVKEFQSLREVNHVSCVHCWTIDGKENVLTAHIYLKKELNDHDKTIARNEIMSIVSKNNIHHPTIQFHE